LLRRRLGVANRGSMNPFKTLSRLSKCTSGLAIGFGVMVLTGWTFHIQKLKGLIPGQVAVKANAAVCFILIGVSLWLVLAEVRKRHGSQLSTALALVASSVGLLSFLEYWKGWDLGIDQLLFRAGAGDLPGSVRPGLMSPISAADLFLLGISIALLQVQGRWARGLQTLLAAVAAVVAMFGVLDFVLDPQKTHTHIAPLTALILLLLSIAVLCARAQGGLGGLLASPTVGGLVSRRLLPSAILIPIVIAWLRWRGHEIGLYSEWTGLAIMTVSAGMLLAGLTVWTAVVLDRTELRRQQAEASVRELAGIVTSSNDAIIGKTLDGIVTSWNPGATAIYGYSAKEMIGQNFNRVVPPELQGEFEDFLQRLRRGESIRSYETERIQKNGKRIPVSITVSPLEDEAGNIMGAATITRNIGERKRAEQALFNSETRYRSLVTATAQVVWTTDPQGMVEDMPMWREITGQTQEQVRETGWLNAVHPEDRERTKQIWARAVNDRSLYDVEYRVRRNDGEYRHFAVRGVPVLQDNGSVAEWVGTCTDITERKRVDQALQLERRRFRDVLDKLPAYVVLLTPDYQVALDNTVFRQRFGESKGRPCYEFLFGRNTPCEICETYNVLETGAPHRWKWTGPDGRHYDVCDFPFPDTDGSPLILEMGLDVTEREKAEEEVRRLNSELEQRVVQRTAQLEAANKELEAFTYSVSHDLRAPLRHISGFSKILVEEFAANLPPEAQQHVQRIQEGTHRMGQLVDDLLNLGRVGRRELTLQVAGVRSIVDKVIHSLKSDVGDRAVEWKIGDLPYVECDTALIEQVFQNLLSNALKFTRPRSQAVIEIGQEQRNGASAVYVRDNGVGFSMKYADQLFGVFQRLHRQEDFEGTGVGLATVQRIIQKHGGRIWAEAELDKGASFYFTFGHEASQEKTKAMVAGEQ